MWTERNTRKPFSLLRLSGLFLLRDTASAEPGLLFQEPPRSARRFPGHPTGYPAKSVYAKWRAKKISGSLTLTMTEISGSVHSDQ